MPFELLVGPPASGKTTRLIARARAAAQGGKRVWWVGLPNQRTYVYRRATEAGGVLGLEFLTAQQVAYRLLAHALRLQPLVVGTARLVLVGEALLEVGRSVPAPGEARLFAYAIAEAKRYGLQAGDIPLHDATTERLRDVFRAYEQLKGEQWDYDDFRVGALALAREPDLHLEADLIVVDGYREVGPLDLRLYRALGEHADVVLALPEAPPGAQPHHSLKDSLENSSPPRVQSFRAQNPVTEARWVLRSVKQALAGGADPLDLAVILPQQQIRAFAALADEYGVPVRDETPTALADTPAGRRLADLLALPDAPTGPRLLTIAELEPLAQAVLRAGVAGPDAVEAVAEQNGMGERWRSWRARLTGDGLEWAQEMVELAVAAATDPAEAERFAEQALRCAKEATALATGRHFREWWAALLQDAELREARPGGVALVDATRASGRRFTRVWIVGAVVGAYRPGAGEDYFVPEEQRAVWADVFHHPGAKNLPRRLRGASEAFFSDLLSRGDVVTVTYPDADRDGPMQPAPELVADPQPLPPVPAGSVLELGSDSVYLAPRAPAELLDPSVERLRRYAECGFRTWAEDLLRSGGPVEETVSDETPWWRKLRTDLLGIADPDMQRLAELGHVYPQAREWLEEHADPLLSLTFDVRLERGADGPYARVDAAHREGSTAVLYRFTAPGSATNPAQAEALIADRWTEMWAAGRLLQGYGGQIERVDIRVWPLLGEPIDVFEGGITYLWRRVKRAQQQVDAAYERFTSGDIEPRPGFICRGCAVADICREGMP